jgi:DNA-binding NtrC family response regulator
MSFILKRKGYDVSFTGDGLEAIEITKVKHFDMILTDIKMPHIDGVATLRMIKKIDPKSIVVMMTAYSVDELIKQGLEEGAYGVLYKPLDIEKLIDLIEESKKTGKAHPILIIDDEPCNVMILQKILSKKGYAVDIAYTGEEASAIEQAKKHEIFFIDLMMPSMNGLKTYLSLKKINPDAVAIIMTGYHQEAQELVEKALQRGAYTCLYKPFEMVDVLRLVGNIFEKKANAQ